MAKRNVFSLTDEETGLVYLAVQTLVQHGINHSDVSIAIKTNSLRASLRNCVAKTNSNTDTQVIQENYEDSARFIASGKWDK